MPPSDQPSDEPVVVDRVVTDRGELVLRRRGEPPGEVWEVVSNGVFLMDSSDGTSERLLVSAALDACTAGAPRLLIGGLGVGFSLVEAVRRPAVRQIDVAEVEPTLVGWHERFLGGRTGDALRDPRVTVRVVDVHDLLRAAPEATYDAICLDTDNGPDWLVTESNAALYADPGLRLLRSRLAPGGALAVWGARFEPAYDGRLRAVFGEVALHEIPRPRGAPDVVWLATVGDWRRTPDLD